MKNNNVRFEEVESFFIQQINFYLSDTIIEKWEPIHLVNGLTLVSVLNGIVLLKQGEQRSNRCLITTFVKNLLREEIWEEYWVKIKEQIDDKTEKEIMDKREKYQLRMMLDVEK